MVGCQLWLYDAYLHVLIVQLPGLPAPATSANAARNTHHAARSLCILDMLGSILNGKLHQC